MIFHLSKTKKIIFAWLATITLLLNIIFLHNVVIGIILSISYFYILSVLLSDYINNFEYGRKMMAFISVFSFIILINLIFLYFFTLNTFSLSLSIGLLPLIITMISFLLPRSNLSNEKLIQKNLFILWPKAYVFYPFFYILILLQIIIIIKIKTAGHIYHGLITGTQNFSLIILGSAFLILFLLIFSQIKNKYLLIAILTLFIVSSASYIILVDNLYGADSWRHLAIEKFVSIGNRYEPTNIGELLQFKSEKIPNASLYTIIPVLYRLTYLPIIYIHKFFQLIFLVPLLLFSLYFGLFDFIKNKQQSLLFVLVLLLSPGILYVGQYNSVQAVGVVYFFINLWLWLRILTGKTAYIPWYNWIISACAILAYPTTGYFSFISIIMILLLRFLNKRNNNFKPFLYGLPLGILFASPIPLLDILLKKIPIDPAYTENWLNLFSIIGNWRKTMFPLESTNPGLFPFILILMLFGFVWIYKHEKYRLFPLLLVLMISLQISQWSASIFQKDTLGIFTGRVQVLLNIFYYITAFIGLRLLLIRIIKTRKKLLFVAIGVGLTLLFVFSTNIANLNFAWSVSKNELAAINYIDNNYSQTSYIVLTDEVTSAAGSSITNMSYSYYWYPNGDLYSSYVNILKSPTVDTLEFICHKYKIHNVFFIDTPIPLTSSYPEAENNISQIMSTKWADNETKVMIYDCQKIEYDESIK